MGFQKKHSLWKGSFCFNTIYTSRLQTLQKWTQNWPILHSFEVAAVSNKFWISVLSRSWLHYTNLWSNPHELIFGSNFKRHFSFFVNFRIYFFIKNKTIKLLSLLYESLNYENRFSIQYARASKSGWHTNQPHVYVCVHVWVIQVMRN